MELEVLLAPLAEHSPCGDDLSFSPEFDTINEMRRADDATIDQGEWVTSLKVADWPGVARTCETLLSTRTKDLRLAMWLTEAWALTQGYKGLGRGLSICTELCERYWEPLHPMADDGDHDQRIGNMRWLLQRVVSLATSLPVAQARKGMVYSLHNLALARQHASLLEREPDEAARHTGDKLTPDQFHRALRDEHTARAKGFNARIGPEPNRTLPIHAGLTRPLHAQRALAPAARPDRLRQNEVRMRTWPCWKRCSFTAARLAMRRKNGCSASNSPRLRAAQRNAEPTKRSPCGGWGRHPTSSRVRFWALRCIIAV